MLQKDKKLPWEREYGMNLKKNHGILRIGRKKVMLHKIKRFMATFFQYRRMIGSSDFQKFIAASDKPRLILLDTPTHGNLGDHAIVLAEKQLLEQISLNKNIYEFTQQEYLLCEKEIYANTNLKDIILIPGGGFIGTLWQNEEDVLLRILDKFRDNRIIILPQTVFFEKTEKGKLEEDKFIYSQKQCHSLTIFVRDQSSLKCLIKMGVDTKKCLFVPDSVTSLEYKKEFKRNDKVLLCLRSDREKTVDLNIVKEILNILSATGLEYSYTDTVVPYRIPKGRRNEEVSKKLQEFAQCKLVITDRIHGMLFAAITGTPCLFMDNCSKKVSGAYEWIKNLEYVKPLTNIDCLKKFISQLEDKKTYQYSNAHLQPYYRKMAEIIRENRPEGGNNSHYE